MPDRRSAKLAFEPRARLLLLLGDQLIRDPGIAIFELVKNAYDADASYAKVILENVSDKKHGRIVVEDDGTGMDWDTITTVWLEPGTDFRSSQVEKEEFTPKFHRLPLGEKGVGRFAAHKLGGNVTLITRHKGKREVVVKITWGVFDSTRYLKDVTSLVEQRPAEVFTGEKTGTRIEITNLRSDWTRGMVRELYRSVMSIRSPFGTKESFKPEIMIHPETKWLDGLLDYSKVLEFSLHRATCWLNGKELRYDYFFKPYPTMDRVERRKCENILMDLPKFPRDSEKNCQWSNSDNLRIGPVRIELRVFDRTPDILRLGVADKAGIKEFLNSNGGIRVYRNDMRVYNYGEPENDWLDLGQRRVNVPTQRISNNIILGAVFLSLAKSRDLIEKTNREGFVENRAYTVFRNAVLFAVKQIEWERNIDKKRIRVAYSRARQKEPVLEDLTELRSEIEKRGLGQELSPYLDRIETQFQDVRDRLLTAAGSGLSLAVVIHEVEKGIAELSKMMKRSPSMDEIRGLAQHLSELVEGLGYLVRRSGMATEKASILIHHAILNTKYRTRYHEIKLTNGLEYGNADFSFKCARRLIIATLMNLIDNSIWWLSNKGGEKRIFLGTTGDLGGIGSIIVADNGPGFIDAPEYLTEPFFTRKPDGMGLGLHLASEVMKLHNGKLEFPDPDGLELPSGFRGAIVALVFGSGK